MTFKMNELGDKNKHAVDSDKNKDNTHRTNRSKSVHREGRSIHPYINM